MHVELERSRQTWGGRDIREHVVMEEERRELGDDRRGVGKGGKTYRIYTTLLRYSCALGEGNCQPARKERRADDTLSASERHIFFLFIPLT